MKKIIFLICFLVISINIFSQEEAKPLKYHVDSESNTYNIISAPSSFIIDFQDYCKPYNPTVRLNGKLFEFTHYKYRKSLKESSTTCSAEDKCSWCNGRGSYDCRTCNGTGKEDDEKCPNCNGRGEFTCEDCNGTGKE